MEFDFLFGILTGIFPSLHPNNLVHLVDSRYLIPIAILHSFINIIPLILFLVPDLYTITSLNASNLMYKKGLAFEAIVFSALASLLGAIFSLLFILVPELFEIIKNFETLSLISLLALFLFLIFYETKTISLFLLKLILILCSFILIKIAVLHGIEPYLLLTGFFGLSSIYWNNVKVNQKLDYEIFTKILNKNYFLILLKFSLIGVLLALPANIFPLVTPTHFLIILNLLSKIGLKESIILVSSMSSSDFILSIITKDFFDYSRNYVIDNAELIPYSEVIKYIILSFFILIALSILLIKLYNKFNQKLINAFILISIFLPLIILGNYLTIILIIIAAILGKLALENNMARINLFNAYIINYLIENKNKLKGLLDIFNS